jgi:hypothetical protein
VEQSVATGQKRDGAMSVVAPKATEAVIDWHIGRNDARARFSRLFNQFIDPCDKTSRYLKTHYLRDLEIKD